MTDLRTPTASRPKMQNYGIATDADGLMVWSWADDQLRNARNYWIASTKPDGVAHVAPVWGVWADASLYFGIDPGSRKARNFAHQPLIALHLESGDDVVILNGRVEWITEAQIFARISTLYTAKYDVNPSDPDSPGAISGYWRFVPLDGLTWLESDFSKTATRWMFA